MKESTVSEHTPIDLEALFKDLHEFPELGFAEFRTARIIAGYLADLGFEVHERVGGTGVVGILRNGDGPTVMMRADMDALPVEEQTGLPYASVVRAAGPDGVEVPVMHACGHDIHVSCLIGVAERLVATRSDWSGVAVAVFQPAEESGTGAEALVTGGILSLVPKVDVILAQHVGPIAAGSVALHVGPTLAAADVLNVRMNGVGGHGSVPATAIDPILMASSAVVRLQSIVSRELGADEMAVVTVGKFEAGTRGSIIPPYADLEINIRTLTKEVRERVIGSVIRILEAEAVASGAPEKPDITAGPSVRATLNDPDAASRVASAFSERFGSSFFDPGSLLASEDIMDLVEPSGAPLVYWFLGGADPATLDTAESNHSPRFAMIPQPTLTVGVDAMVTAAMVWLGSSRR